MGARMTSPHPAESRARDELRTVLMNPPDDPGVLRSRMVDVLSELCHAPFERWPQCAVELRHIMLAHPETDKTQRPAREWMWSRLSTIEKMQYRKTNKF